ncbi:hypothetical protein EDD18DRAFT_1467088 [Armillaria luteobubalina]|uniref:Uncharacterized protein n=1 Tax=Armillaria luteobubalina TaxID=153913 RepID=A0AA39PK05_9AGAR|nr:hypothetical protein EDD18DRAFT_1467088 [Armillaria luteobubalina]
MVPGHHDIDFEICPGSIVFVPRFVHRVARVGPSFVGGSHHHLSPLLQFGARPGSLGNDPNTFGRKHTGEIVARSSPGGGSISLPPLSGTGITFARVSLLLKGSRTEAAFSSKSRAYQHPSSPFPRLSLAYISGERSSDLFFLQSSIDF